MSHFPAYSWRSYHPTAQLRYITDADNADIYLAALDGPVGFDLEWKPTFAKGAPENPVALVQLANSESILLIQISSMQRNSFLSTFSLSSSIFSFQDFRTNSVNFLKIPTLSKPASPFKVCLSTIPRLFAKLHR